jgi:hypothetical protein
MRKQPKCCVDGRLMGMNFRKSLAVVLFGLGMNLGCAAVAHAQAGLYLGYTGSRLSGIPCDEVAPLTCANGVASGAKGDVNPSGIQFGGYYDFKTVGPVRLGLDLRGGDYHSNKSATSSAGGKNATGLDDVLLGVRGSFRTHYSWLSPYAQISAGYARSNAAEPFGTLNSQFTRYEDNFVMYEGFVGVDIHVFPLLDLRPVELGIGNMNRFGSGSGLDQTSSVGVKSIGAAIVFHLPSLH